MTQRLTDIVIRRLEPRTTQYEVRDDLVVGLCVRVSPGGKKAFNLLYRFNGLARRLTLGRFGDLSLAEARDFAREKKRLIYRGEDPQALKLADRLRHKSLLYPDMTELYIEHAKKITRDWRETQRVLNRAEIVDAWRRKPITEIRKADVIAVLAAVGERGPSAAAHAFANIRRCMNFWVSQELIQSNPCEKVKLVHKPKAREKVLTDGELARIWLAAHRMEHPFGPFIHLLMLTLQRRNEVAHIRGADIDEAAMIWTQRVNKSNRIHRVHLSEDALSILQTLRRVDDARYLFEARGSENAISGFSKWKVKLDHSAGVTGWTLHDLRRSATTRMSELDIEIHVGEMILNHETSKMTKLARVYNRNQFDKEQREAMGRWASHIKQIVATVADELDTRDIATSTTDSGRVLSECRKSLSAECVRSITNTKSLKLPRTLLRGYGQR